MTTQAHARSRTMRSLFGSVAIGTTGFFTAVAMTPLLAEDLIGETWSGVPSTAMVLSTAAGTAVLSRLMAARGRRPGLVTGYAVGAVGAAGVVVAAQTSTFALMVVASLAIGGSQAANQLSRYAAADLHPSESRGAALGLVVWAGTVGALLGPNMLPVAGSVAERLGGRALAGPHGFAAAAMVLAALVCAVRLRPDPRELVVADDVGETVEGVDRRAAVRVAVTALIAGQVVMVLIMTMTPVHIRHSGSGLSVVGGVMSAHIVGMYAFTPVVGRLADRFGSLRVIAGGLTALGAAGVGAASIPGGGGLGAPLFLLGIGWSATFVAGSALLTGGLPYAERVRLQGIVDTVVWSSSAAASLVSGLILSTAGYGVLGASGTGLAVAAAVVVLALREPRPTRARAVRLDSLHEHKEGRMGYGLTIPVGGQLHKERDLIESLPDLGYTDVWSSEAGGADGFTPLALASVWAPALRLGVAIVPAFTRGPATMAQCVASLASAAPGRFVFGIGTSSDVIVERWNGIPFEEPFKRTRDMVRFLRASLGGEKVSEDYDTFSVKGFRLGIVPPEQPKILVGALRSGMLRMSGREADGAIINWLSADDVKQVVPYVHEGGPDKEVVARVFVAPTTDRDAVMAGGKFAIAAYLNVPVYAKFHEWVGRGEALKGMWDAWKAGDRKAAVAAIPDEVVDELIVHGSPEECREHVQRYMDNGVDVPALAFLPFGYDVRQAIKDMAPR